MTGPHSRRPAALPALAFAAAAACALPSAALAATLSVPAAYPTIQAAVDAAAPGDTVEVSNGVYHEMVTFPASGTAGNPITLAAKPGHSPVIDGTGLATTDAEGLVSIDDRAFVTVRGFEIRNLSASSPAHFPAGIWIRGQSHHVEIRDNVVHHIENAGCASCGAHAIAAYGTSAAGSIHDLVIDGNEVRDCVLGWSESVVVNGNVEGFAITNNTVHHNNNIGIDAIGFEGECAGCGDALDRARDGLIAGNLVHDIDSLSNPAYGGSRSADGIYVDGGTRIVIERNVVHHSNIGIELASEHSGKDTSEVVVRNNFVYASHAIGIAIGGYDTRRGSTRDCAIVHNTLHGNDTDLSGGGEMLLQYDIRDNTIANNVIVAGLQNQFLANEFTLTSGNVIDHNVYFSVGGAAASQWTWTGTPHAGFAAWQAATGNDANSIFADPLLVAPAGGDLHLGPGSPAVGAAVALSPDVAGTVDIDGTPRVSGPAPDAGADELACGNGAVEGDEECDDGDLVDGDGCDSNCTATGCGNGIVTAGEACDDGNAAAGDCCDGACALETAGSPCDDGEACTRDDACDGAGACEGEAGVDAACLLPDAMTAGSRLQLRDNGSSGDRLSWSWGKGPAVSLSSLGDPTAGDDYRLCVYADDGSGARVLLEASAPGGAGWAAQSSGFKYGVKDLAPDGLRQVQLKAGDAGRAKTKVKGQGALLGVAGLGFGPGASVSVELRSVATGACLGAEYAAPFRVDDASRLDARSN